MGKPLPLRGELVLGLAAVRVKSDATESIMKYRILVVSIVIVILGLIIGPLTNGGEPQKAIHQLRIYEIFDGNKKAFHDRFRDDAMRIMAKYDFKMVATWESKKDNRTEFVYLLEWPDNETMADRWDNSCMMKNGLGLRRRRAKRSGRSSVRFRIGPCI
jgi:hypothetical protein